MRGGWKRFGLYVMAVTAVIALVFVATNDEPQTTGSVAAQVAFIGAMSYLLTFLVWPRRALVQHRAPIKKPTPTKAKPEFDRRPVAVIGNRPAGSKPGSRVHLPEAPTARGTRGRRPDDRQPTGEMRWPAQR